MEKKIWQINLKNYSCKKERKEGGDRMFPDIWGVSKKTALLDVRNPSDLGIVKVEHRKPVGYSYDSVWLSEEDAERFADRLQGLGYKTKIIEESQHWYVYKQKI